MRTYSAQKAALTRAKNSGDPYKLKAECNRFFNEYEDAHQPLPDDWYRWNIAGNDAVQEISRREWDN